MAKKEPVSARKMAIGMVMVLSFVISAFALSVDDPSGTAKYTGIICGAVSTALLLDLFFFGWAPSGTTLDGNGDKAS